MMKFVIIFGLVTISLAFPQNELKTTFIHPNARQSTLSSSQMKIINGQTATPHQFPYQVGIYVHKNGVTDFCGGSFISNNYVLTAAHCLDPVTDVVLVFGAHNITDSTEKSQIRVTTENFVIHKEWNSQTLTNDIGLIKLPSPIKETNEIKIVALAKGSDSYSNQNGIVAGWGVTKMSQSGVTPLLKYITSLVMSNNDCKQIDNDYDQVITDNLLCLSPGQNKLATCHGDSGGPLVVNKVQVGIVSFGATDCESGKPSVFTRITQYLDWIKKNSDVKF